MAYGLVGDQKLKVYIETYGCTMNRADSQLIRELLDERGHVIVDDLEEADVVIVNTCTVRGDTQAKVVERIRVLRGLMKRRGGRLVVAGCMVKAQPYLVVREAPEASLITPQAISRIVDVVESKGRVVFFDGTPRDEKLPKTCNGVVAAVPVAEGCLGACNYCIVRIARGPLRSYPIDRIVNVIRELVSRGVVEIQLTGQDVAAYGRDIGVKLPTLLEEISGLKGDFMVRVGMMNPNHVVDIVDELVEAYRSDKIYKFLHIPVQSGDNKVLKAMNRPYTVEEFESLILEFKSKIPEVSIATDIIVGHPGEDEEAFINTVELVKRLEFDRVHVAHYSVRPHTPSARMPQVPSPIRKRRVLELMKVVEEVGLKRHRRFIGRELEVLFTEVGRSNTIVGRDKSYYPVVVCGEPKLIGRRGLVRVRDATFYDLRGELVGPGG